MSGAHCKARTFSEEMRQAVIIVVQKASSSARSHGMPSKIIPGWHRTHRTIGQANFQTKNEFQLNLTCKLRPGKNCLKTKLPSATCHLPHMVYCQVASLVLEFGWTSSRLPVVHNSIASIANGQTVARFSWYVTQLINLSNGDAIVRVNSA